MMEDTLMVRGGEFGRTSMRENRSGAGDEICGARSQSRAFTICLAGAGVKPGMFLGQTDDLGYESQGSDEVRDRDHVVSPWL
jgi:uncharacterized protein DUF1501